MNCTQEYTWRRDDGATVVSTCDNDAQRTWEAKPVCDGCFAELLDQAHEFGENRGHKANCPGTFDDPCDGGEGECRY